MSWDQIYLAAESIVVHKTEAMNMLLQPMIATLGGKYNPSKVNKRQQNKTKRDTKMTPLQKEQLLVNRFQAAGLPVSEK